MPVDYKKELENAAKSMILVHKPDTLIRMIVRMIVQRVNVKHAGILLHLKDKDTYVLAVSRGPTGVKIPAGFARVDHDNPLIRIFEKPHRKLFTSGALVYDSARALLRKKKINPRFKSLISGLLRQMEVFSIVACVPSYFRDDLLGILLLGEKKRGNSFTQKELDFFMALASDVAMAMRNAQLFRDLELEIDKTHRLFINTTVTLAAAIDAKDHYTHNHISRVTSLAMAIAEKISQKSKKTFDKKFLEDLQIAGLLHDIGKIGIPESILNKQGPLTPEERSVIKEHPNLGVTILKPIPELKESLLGVKYHHEKYDGTGYPDGLRAEQIPLIAAIISVADAFDAMITDRPYRMALTKDAAIAEITRESGKQFHPEIASAITELYRENKI